MGRSCNTERMGTNGKIYKRGKVFWFEDPSGKRTSLRTRDRGEAQSLAAARVQQRRTVSAFSAPPSQVAQPSISAPPPVDSDGIDGADFTASVGAEQTASAEHVDGSRLPPNQGSESVAGDLVSDGLTPEQDALAEQLSRMIVLASSVACVLAIRSMGGIAKEPPQAAQDALAGAWLSKCRIWVADDTISPWTLIVGATVALGLSQLGGAAPVPAPSASPETVVAEGA